MPRRGARDPRAHRMADEAGARQAERGDERRDVVGLRIEAVVERRRRVGQPAAAYVEHVGIERRAEYFADETPRDRVAVMPGISTIAGREARAPLAPP